MRGRPNHRVGGGSHLGHRGHLGSLIHQSYLGHLSEEEQGVGVTDGDSSWGELLDEGLMLVIAVVRGATEHRSEFIGQLLNAVAVYYRVIVADQTIDQGHR